MEGLQDYLQYALLNLRFDDFNHLVDSAINTERKHLEIHYHPGKANVVADALSRRSYVNMAVAFQMPLELCEEFEQLSLGFLHHTSCAAFEAVPTLESEIRQHQKDDEKLQEIRELLKKGKAPHFSEDDQGTLCARCE